MSRDIKIVRNQHSTLNQVDFNNIPFGKVFSDHMFVADYENGEWADFRIVPTKEFSVHPANLAWHYGQSIFEGMKASKNQEGEPLLYRPDKHIARFNKSAVRMSMPEFPEDVFSTALKMLVEIDKDWVPTQESSSLYIRPFMIASENHIGVRPSKKYKMVIITLPVGPYYDKPLSLLVQTKYIRAVEGGVGFAKTAGNYAAAMYPTRLANEAGFDQIVWMEPKEFKYVQEVGTMNIFFVLKDKIVTPMTSGAVLEGITRDSVIHILKSKGYNIVEEKVSIADIYQAYLNGELIEVFGSGTAAVIINVNKIRYGNNDMLFDLSNIQISSMLKETITDIRTGRSEDVWNWTENTSGALKEVESFS